jgi:branched-chain amino acid transport system substrate-binding protein
MNRKAVIVLSVFIFLIIVKFTYSYFSTYEYSLQVRADLAAEKKQDIHVAVVWDKSETSFMQGVTMAVTEINQQGVALKWNNEIIKAHIILHEYDDSTEDAAKKSRLSIANDHRIVAVLGHSTSASAIPASITYEYNGILFISAVATMPTLTNHNFKYTFSIIPSEFFFANRLAKFVKKKGWNNLLILHARNPYGLSFYEAFAAQVEPPLHIVSVKSFFTGEKDYKELIYTVMQNDFDAVILADAEQNAAEMIKQLRYMGVHKPILGGDGLDNLKIWEWSGQTANQLYVASVLAGQGGYNNKDAQNFSSNYVIYQGYEAAHILADAIEKTGSSEPILVASVLKYNYKNGYAGYIFDVNGLVINKNIYVKEFKNGKFLSVDNEE